MEHFNVSDVIICWLYVTWLECID